jgi:hypothetical protein
MKNNGIRIVGVCLLVLGILGVVYNRVGYTKDETKAELGPITVKVQEKESVAIPQWLAVATLAVGAALALAPIKKV